MNQKIHFLFLSVLFFLYGIQLSFASGSSAKMSYQAVVRNASGQLIANSAVSVSISIHRGAADGNIVYSENHDVNTNENGLLTLIIGDGNIHTGTPLDKIDWGADNYFLKSKIDPLGGTNFILESVTPLLSVPYAIHAQQAQRLTQAISYNDLEDVPISFSGDYADLKNIPLFNVRDSILQYGFTGDYNELSNIPDVNIKDSVDRYKFSGDYNDLINAPLVNIKDTVDKYNFSGDYHDLSNKPSGNNEGDILYWSKASETPSWEILPMGQEGQFLAVSNGKLTWLDPSFANTSATTYKVGDIYLDSNGNPEGIVFELSTVGRYAKIVSLEEFSNIAWDPLGTEESMNDINHVGLKPQLTKANNRIDGLENLRMIQSFNNWKVSYPAFGQAVSLGEGWYLPSLNELLQIFKLKQSLNEKLNQIAAAPIESNCYWSSTEFEQFHAYAVAFKNYDLEIGGEIIDVSAGDYFELLKDDNNSIRGIRTLNWSETTSKPSEKKYQLGDIIYDDIIPIGMVYEISDGGLHGKMLSLQTDSLAWSNNLIFENAVSEEDGSKNCEIIFSKTLIDYPAFEWVSKLGDGWYIPSIIELTKIAVNAAMYNNLLPKSAQLKLKDIYCSSTEFDKDKVFYTDFNNKESVEASKTDKARIIAVKQF